MFIDLEHNFEIEKCIRKIRKLLLLLWSSLETFLTWFCITSYKLPDPSSIFHSPGSESGVKTARRGTRHRHFRGWLCIPWGRRRGHWSSEQGNLGPLKGHQAFGMRDYARDDRAKHRKLPPVSASVWTPANFLVNRSTFVKIGGGGNYTNPASWRCGRAWVFARVMNEVGELGG